MMRNLLLAHCEVVKIKVQCYMSCLPDVQTAKLTLVLDLAKLVNYMPNHKSHCLI